MINIFLLGLFDCLYDGFTFSFLYMAYPLTHILLYTQLFSHTFLTHYAYTHSTYKLISHTLLTNCSHTKCLIDTYSLTPTKLGVTLTWYKWSCGDRCCGGPRWISINTRTAAWDRAPATIWICISMKKYISMLKQQYFVLSPLKKQYPSKMLMIHKQKLKIKTMYNYTQSG